MRDKQAYVFWGEGDDKGMTKALAGVTKALNQINIQRSVSSDIFFNIAPHNTSVRDGYKRGDYDSFRPEERIPTKPKEVIRACMNAYHEFGLIRNVIDLMADFATQGIGIVHPNKRIERFYQEWFRKVDVRERSERFMNVLYRTANVVVKRQTAKISVVAEEEMKRAATADIPTDYKFEKREIPWKYTFLNPLSLELIGEEIAPFLGVDYFNFSLQIPDVIIKLVKGAKGREKELVAALPPDIRSAVQNGGKTVPLDSKNIRAFYYKRDDWQGWAVPMLRCVLTDLNMLSKMKLADLSALDGAISNIRIWKLGNLDAKIMPSEATMLRLAEMLNNNVGGGVMDLVWGPDIELKETSTEVYKFLGATKYEPVLNLIFQGLGIPPTLTGSVQGSFTNNFISLKTLIERLEYGRSVLRTFWEYEIRLVQKAMGFRVPATLTFDRMVLNDEATEKQLLINLFDRMGISLESLQERFGETPEIEALRIKREEKARLSGKAPQKASPFHDPMGEWALKKIYAQSGAYAPSEMGLELEPKKAGEQAPGEITAGEPDKALKGQPGEGRPTGSKDKVKRKDKVVKPRTSAFVEALDYAARAQATIAQHISPAYLKSLGKKTMRELTVDEERKIEDFKFAVLCQFQLGQAVDQDSIKALLGQALSVPAHVRELLRVAVSKFVEANEKDPPLEVLRRFQASVYALDKGEFED